MLAGTNREPYGWTRSAALVDVVVASGPLEVELELILVDPDEELD